MNPCSLQQGSLVFDCIGRGLRRRPPRNGSRYRCATVTPRAASGDGPSPLLRPAVSLDAEFGHWRSGGGAEVAVAAWVALVGEDGRVLLDTRVRQECQLPRGTSWRHWGGVPAAACAAAPRRGEVLASLLALLEGRLLVGHGVARDAAALGLVAAGGQAQQAPPRRQGAGAGAAPRPPAGAILWLTPAGGAARAAAAFNAVESGGASAPVQAAAMAVAAAAAGAEGRAGPVEGAAGAGRAAAGPPPGPPPRYPAYDTKAFPGFQGRGGAAFTLQRLARDHLGRGIQGSAAGGGSGGGDDHGGGDRRQQQRARRRPGQPGGAPQPHDAVEDARAVMDLFVGVARPRLLLDAAAAAEAGPGAPARGAGSAAFERLVELQTAALLAAAKAGGGAPGGGAGADE